MSQFGFEFEFSKMSDIQIFSIFYFDASPKQTCPLDYFPIKQYSQRF